MRVLLLVTDLRPGGTPLRLARQARRLHEAGLDVLVGCLAEAGELNQDLEGAGVPTFACGGRRQADFPKVLSRLSRRVRQFRPDLIHSTLFHANLAARTVGRVQRVPVIGSTATIEVERGWHLLCERASIWCDRLHVVNSQTLADHVHARLGASRDRITIVPPSLDPPPRRGDRGQARATYAAAPEDFVIVWVGRMDPVKRLDIVVGAAGELLRRRVPVRVLLAGDGPERPRLERRLRSNRAADRVRVLGWCRDVSEVLSAADAFLFPSRTEGLPNAVLEALYCGVPVVASDIAAHRELLADGWRGRLVQGCRADAYADVLQSLYAEPDERRALGSAGREWATTTLDPRRTTEALLAAYRRALTYPS